MGSRTRTVALMLFVMNFVMSTCSPVYAVDSGQYVKERQKVLFVVDISNSMNYQDSNRLVNETVKMLIDTFDSTYTSVGFITYNDAITNVYPITPIAEKKTRDEIKERIDGAARTGNTDIGMAIHTGMDMLLENDNGENLTMVLISDGETDLTYTRTGRTMEDSRNDEAAALAKAKENDCRIFAVGVSADGSLDTSYLDGLSNETGGKKYDVKNSQEIFDIFPDLYQSITGTAVVNSGVLIGTGQIQSVSVEIPVQFIQETNLVVMNNNRMQDLRVTYTSGGLSLFESKNYTSIKIVDALTDNIDISVSGAQGDEIRICAIHHLNFYPKIELPDEKERTALPVTVRLYQMGEHSLINDSALYSQMNVDLAVIDTATYQIEKVAMANNGDRYTAQIPWDNAKEYSLVATVKHPAFEHVSDELRIGAVNTIPRFSEGPEFRAYGKAEIDLSLYFTDDDNETLTYELLNAEKLGGKHLFGEDILTLDSVPSGEYRLEILAIDGAGSAVTGTILYEAIPFYQHYRNQIAGVLVIFIILLLALILFTRQRTAQGAVKNKGEVLPTYRFSRAKFEGYFDATASGNEIPVLVWNANLVDNKISVTLGQLLKMMKVNEKLPEADSMQLTAGKNGTVVFSHNTEAQIKLRQYAVPPGEKVTLEYDTSLYIVFEDGETRLELRYKRSRNMQY